jgi:aquaporin Z
LIDLISIPVTNPSVNPARSAGAALFVSHWAMAQFWLFWVVPIIGALLGALVYRFIGESKTSSSAGSGETEAFLSEFIR